MNQQVLRILTLLPHAQLVSMHEEAVDALNLFHYNNDGRDDISGHIAKTLEEMSSDIQHLDFAVHNAFIAKQVELADYSMDLPF